ncbi:MAG: tetratricopeptide repeat protein [Clostridia bacterium]|nr:tetratricopeptide repeat protein [Clostridia bacterium]
MATFSYQVKGNGDPKGRPRVYFTCHPDDFESYFEKIRDDLFKTHNCALYYTEDLTAPHDEAALDVDLGQMNLFVVPVTAKLLTTPCRAMEQDLAYAKAHHINILPFMMETGIDELYARPEAFGELQYLNPFSTDATEISYESKLEKYLNSVLVNDETAARVRAAFDAYIFLSYRKKDRLYANRLMQMIHRTPGFRDIAIWYDEFLTPGESFSQNIRRAMENSRLFALLVTPNLLEEPGGKPNFVMGEEYPAATRANMPILPAEMVETDRAALAEKFQGIPDCVDAEDETAFRERLLSALTRIAVTANDNDPEHNFLIGLAYLEGIDVEVDRALGLRLVTEAAEAGVIDAMVRLYHMYSEGHGVPLNYAEAHRWAKRLYDECLNQFGEKDERTLAALNSLAVTTRKAGHRADAMTLAEQVIARSREILGEDHPETLSALNNFFVALSAEKLHERAVAVGEEAAAKSAALLGEEHEYTLTILYNLAIALRETERKGEAAALNRRVYETRLRLLGETHPSTLLCLGGLVKDSLWAARQSGDYAEALALAEKNLTLRQGELGEKHPNVLTAMTDLADAHASAGNLDEALALAEKIYALRCEVLGETHYDSIYALSNLCAVHAARREYEAMEPLALREYELSCIAFGANHPETLRVLDKRLTIANELRKYLELADIAEPLYEGRRATLGESHPETARVRRTLASIFKAFGDRDLVRTRRAEAERLCLASYEKNGAAHPETIRRLNRLILLDGTDPEKVPTIEESVFEQLTGTGSGLNAHQAEALHTVLANHYGETHPQALRYLGIAASTYEELSGYKEKANALRQKSFDIRLKANNDLWDWSIDSAFFLLGAGYMDDNPEKAAELFLTLREKRRATWGADHISYRDATDNIAEAYEKAGNYAEAAKYYKEAFEIRLATDGLSKAFTRTALWDLASATEHAGDHAGAAALYQSLYEADCIHLGEKHADTLTALTSAALETAAAGDHKGAVRLFEKLYDAYCETQGAEHINAQLAFAKIAYETGEAGDHERSAKLYEELYELRLRLLGEENEKTLLALSNLAYEHSAAGHLDEAARCYGLLYESRCKLLGKDDPSTKQALDNLNTVRARLENKTE